MRWGGPRPAVFILTARHRTRPKWCHPGVPSEPTKTDVSGCSMNVRAIFLDTSLEVCDCRLVNTCKLIDLIDFSQFLGKGRCLSVSTGHTYPQIPIVCFPNKTWMIFKLNFRTLPHLLPGYFAPEAVGIPTAFG